MSKIKIVGHASGTGILTIAAPNTNEDRTITIPDVTGTLLDSGSDLPAANLTGTIADARLSSGVTSAKLPLAGGTMTGALDFGNFKLGDQTLDGNTQIFRNYAGSTEYMRIDSSGNVGIGTSSPSYALHVNSGSDEINTWFQTTHSSNCKLQLSSAYTDTYARITESAGQLSLEADIAAAASNSLIKFKVDGSERMRLTTAGALHVDGDVIAYSTTISDEKLKENIQPIEDALNKVNQLKGCTFTYTPDGKESAGLIAQDVEKVLPSAVSESELPLKQDDGKEYKVLQYNQTIGLLVEAIKELTDKVEKLEAR